MVSYKVAVSIQPSHFSNIERKFDLINKTSAAKGDTEGLKCPHGNLSILKIIRNLTPVW